MCGCGQFICCLSPKIKTMMINYPRVLKLFGCHILYVPDLAKNNLFQVNLVDKNVKIIAVLLLDLLTVVSTLQCN